MMSTSEIALRAFWPSVGRTSRVATIIAGALAIGRLVAKGALEWRYGQELAAAPQWNLRVYFDLSYTPKAAFSVASAFGTAVFGSSFPSISSET